MSDLTRAWSDSTPQGSDYANQLDTFLQYLRTDVRQRMELEHYWKNAVDIDADDCDGRHYPGHVSAVYIGTWDQIQALTGMHAGAMAYGTDTSTLYIYDGSAWDTRIVTNLGGPEIDLSGISPVLDSSVEFTDTDNHPWDDAIDDDLSSYCEIKISGNTGYYNTYITLDLGAVYKGYFSLIGDVKAAASHSATVIQTDGKGFRIAPFCGYSNISWATNTSTNTISRDAIVTGNNGEFIQYGSWFVPFYGQYLGMLFHINGYLNLRQLKVFGVEV